MASLYAIIKENNSLYEHLANMADDIPPEQLSDIMASAQEVFEVKVERVIAFIKQLEHDADGHKQIATKHTLKAKQMDRQVENLKRYLLICMNEAGVKKAGSLEHCATLPKPKPSLVIDDTRIIPEQFRIKETVEKVDNAGIKELLLTGAELPFAHLEYKQTVRVE